MRFLKYLNEEWKYHQGEAGRGIARSADEKDDDIDDYLSDSQYKKHEIMIKCTGYYVVSEDSWDLLCPSLFGTVLVLK